MSSWIKQIERGVEFAQLCATGFDVIKELVKHRPKNALDLIGKIVDGVQAALSDNRPLSEVRAEILKLRDSLSSEDAAADAAGDAALDKRFPRG